MPGLQTVWGIDIGRCALKALKLSAADEKVTVLACDYIEHAKILSQPDADRDELIRSALEKFLSRNDVSKDDVVVSVPGQHTLARFTKLPPVTQKKIPEIVRYEAQQQIPFDMDEVIWDYQTFQQEGLPDLEVGIFAMKRELIREHLLYFEQAAIEPIAVQSGPLALYNAACFDGMLGKETTILLDIGAENTDLVIATQDSFWTRTVPLGGNSFTEALVKSFKLSFSKAESLKRTADTSKYARQIFQAMRPVFADLVQELQRSIGFYSATHRDTKVEKIVGLGNAFKLPGLSKYLQQNLGLPVERPEAFRKVASSDAVRARDLKEQLLGFGVAYGLALQGLNVAKVASNLLPTEIAKQAVWRKKQPWFGAAAACLLLAGAAVWFRQVSDMGALAEDAEGSRPTFHSVEEAWGVIDGGPSPALSDRAQVEVILAAGNYLKKELNALSGQGESERAETEAIVNLWRHKTLIPKIVHVIHESAPLPTDPLGQARTQAEVLEAIAKGAAPRGRRPQVYIKKLRMHFEPNVNDYVWQSLVPVPEPINDPDSEVPAIKIEITCRTPYRGGTDLEFNSATEFISGAFMDSLRKNGRRPGTGFYFDRVYLHYGEQVKAPASVARSSGSSRFSSGGRGRGFGSAGKRGGEGVPALEGVPPESLDPITNEPIVEDWEFEIWIDAILEDYPGDEEQEGQGGG